mmetsp:Transcript_48397/g.138265  ORF Transcript_48397/g.138265 Transcript_48397/m.138265 type:complete len:305 (+) Transcript_48397:497-1411(+)
MVEPTTSTATGVAPRPRRAGARGRSPLALPARAQPSALRPRLAASCSAAAARSHSRTGSGPRVATGTAPGGTAQGSCAQSAPASTHMVSMARAHMPMAQTHSSSACRSDVTSARCSPSTVASLDSRALSRASCHPVPSCEATARVGCGTTCAGNRHGWLMPQCMISDGGTQAVLSPCAVMPLMHSPSPMRTSTSEALPGSGGTSGPNVPPPSAPTPAGSWAKVGPACPGPLPAKACNPSNPSAAPPGPLLTAAKPAAKPAALSINSEGSNVGISDPCSNEVSVDQCSPPLWPWGSPSLPAPPGS